MSLLIKLIYFRNVGSFKLIINVFLLVLNYVKFLFYNRYLFFITIGIDLFRVVKNSFLSSDSAWIICIFYLNLQVG